MQSVVQHRRLTGAKILNKHLKSLRKLKEAVGSRPAPVVTLSSRGIALGNQNVADRQCGDNIQIQFTFKRDEQRKH
jgi:hypothetical protein